MAERDAPLQPVRVQPRAGRQRAHAARSTSCLLAAIVIAGLLLDLLLPLLAVGLVVYGIAAARTYFDEDEANKVLERERGEAPQGTRGGPARPGAPSPSRSPGC